MYVCYVPITYCSAVDIDVKLYVHLVVRPLEHWTECARDILSYMEVLGRCE